jgi:hypothetical protein
MLQRKNKHKRCMHTKNSAEVTYVLRQIRKEWLENIVLYGTGFDQDWTTFKITFCQQGILKHLVFTHVRF